MERQTRSRPPNNAVTSPHALPRRDDPARCLLRSPATERRTNEPRRCGPDRRGTHPHGGSSDRSNQQRTTQRDDCRRPPSHTEHGSPRAHRHRKGDREAPRTQHLRIHLRRRRRQRLRAPRPELPPHAPLRWPRRPLYGGRRRTRLQLQLPLRPPPHRSRPRRWTADVTSPVTNRNRPLRPRHPPPLGSVDAAHVAQVARQERLDELRAGARVGVVADIERHNGERALVEGASRVVVAVGPLARDAEQCRIG